MQTTEIPTTLDGCVRLVSACGSFADLQDTQPSYAPTFYRHGLTKPQIVAAHRVTAAFNAWASRPENGRQRLAEVR